MMKLGFYQFSKAWYYERLKAEIDFVDEIIIGNYDTDGGCEYEFKVSWQKLGGDVVPQLCVFDDAWEGLYKNHQDLLKYMAEQNYVSPDNMFDALIEMGYTDFTMYECER